MQPSVSWMSLNEDIKDSGLFFPVDPGPSVCLEDHYPFLPPMFNFVKGKDWRNGRNELQVSVCDQYLHVMLTAGSGTNAVRYGTMKDWVINLTVVLADGTIIKTRKRPRYVLHII